MYECVTVWGLVVGLRGLNVQFPLCMSKLNETTDVTIGLNEGPVWKRHEGAGIEFKTCSHRREIDVKSY